ncbi:50S ribosomal protein L4 [Dehalobacterium formicoaceticum]|uniref:Large ribosomal subunit protein uL4 n=1 Tax=Dehalobacterium formicoaceticum TaxID=51515 RepID=A0ABT1Y180_9FIRM|nr:50S ribosomal protein L4 [Dehalobacterium formicoaceticum]MCR6543955.1 50S ribosomal protein L4 [Dehalobacterium formicoaceticum]
MPKVAVYNMQGSQIGELELNDEIFGVQINTHLLHQAVVSNQASLRRGTHATKTRAMVSGGGKKPWRQKGTGRARVGSSRNPVWTKGGIAFGPHPRSYGFKMPRKVRRLALKSALTDKVNNGNIIVLEELVMAEPKTKEMAQVLNALDAPNALVVIGSADENVVKSIRNIEGATPVEAAGINVYNILNHKKLIMTKDAVAKIEEVLANA